MKGDTADPDFQIATLSYAFYVRADSEIAWDGKTMTGLNRPIGANLGWSIVQDLKKMNLPVETAKDTQNNFNKLLLARIDAVAMHTTIGDAYLEDHALAEKVKLLQPPITSKPYYLVFSRAWHAAHPGAADCMWQSIAQQHKTTLPDLLLRYRDTIN
jgi:polar amino acid transport system substrate-binding protein